MLQKTQLHIKAILSVVMLAISTMIFAQNIVVKGIVSDDSGPIPGVNVMVSGQKTGTITDINGEFSVKAQKTGSLVFTFIGYTTKIVPINAQTKINVTLIESSRELDEVVVVGYGTMKKRDVTGAITSVNAENLTNNAPTNLSGALQGKVAGLEIALSSEPGSESSYRIRGASTLSETGAQPLFIVDGMELDNIDNINPRDIASVEVLKDAASAAIYGSKSANGVIIITTKEGNSSKPKFSVSTSVRRSEIGHTLPQANRREAMDYEILRAYLEARTPTAFVRDSLNPSFISDNNYQDILFRAAYSKQLDVSIAGAERKLKYFASAGLLDDQGIQLNTYNKRMNTRLNADYKATEKFSISNRFNFSAGKNRIVPNGSRTRLLDRPANMALYLPNGTYAPVIASRTNPLAFAMTAVNDNNYFDLSISEFFEYKLSKSLRFKSSIAGSLFQNNYRVFTPSFLVQTSIPSSSNRFTTRYKWTHEDILTYNKTFRKDHAVTAMAAFSLQEGVTDFLNLAVTENISEAIQTSSGYINVDIPNTRNSWSINRMASIFGRLSYSYKGKYLLNSTLRYDGSSRFGSDTRWGYFPSTSVGWRFSDEQFMNFTKGFLSDAKLRYSFGITGNQAAGDFAASSQYSTVAYADYIGIYPTQLENNLLGWETTKQHNVGLDLSLFKSRVSLNIDYYIKKTSDVLFNMKLPETTGFVSSYLNIGAVDNNGFEFVLSTKNIVTKDFDWSTSFNFALNNNVLANIPSESVNILNNVYILDNGYTLGTMYGYKVNAIFPYDQSNAFTPEWVQLTPIFDEKDRFVEYQLNGMKYTDEVKQVRYGTSTGEIFKGGDVMWDDLNKDGVIDAEDRQVIGNGQHDIIGGFNNELRYKNFTLSTFFSFAFGGDVYNVAEYVRSNHKFSTLSVANPINVANSWHAPGDIALYPIPSLKRNIVDNTRNTSSQWIEDGSYIRLKNLKFGYILPQKFSKSIGIESANLNLMLQDFFTWTNYSGFDPEIPSVGFTVGYDNNSYPKSKSLLLGLNINF